MGAFKDAVDKAMGVWFSDDYAEQITYNGSWVYALIKYGGGSTGTVADTAVLEVQISDVANPQYRDPVVISGETWRVYRDKSQGIIITGDSYTWKIPIKKDERPSFR